MAAEAGQGRTFTYLRISEDRGGTYASVGNQRSDVEAMLDRLGLVSDGEFLDNDISASSFSRKDRPGYDGLVAAIRQGGGPVTVAVWHLDRLYRRPKELEALIDLVDKHPVCIEAVAGGGIDLNTHDGRLQARLLVSMAAFESGHKADRIKLANRRKAEAGDWHGPRSFGFQVIPGTGTAELDPVEAPILREAVGRFIAGESLRSITAWITSTGVKPVHAKKWSDHTIRGMLTAPRIAGLRAYDPEVSSQAAGRRREVVAEGRWPAVVTRAQWERCCTILDDPSRRVNRQGQHLLSGIARCGKCDLPLFIAHQGKNHGPSYACRWSAQEPQRGGVAISQRTLDEIVSKAILTRLGASEVPRSSAVDTTAWSALAAARQRLKDLAGDFGAGLITRSEWMAARDTTRSAIANAERRTGVGTQSEALAGLPLGDPEALAERWAKLPLSRQRAVVKAMVDELVIMPTGRATKFVDIERIRLRWRA